jgi:YidC/Oxa1 family membrane protein insertase
MDRQTTIGFVLIFVLLMAWMYMNAPNESTKQQKATAARIDSAKSELAKPQPLPIPAAKENPGKFFSQRTVGQEQTYRIETELYSAELSTKGGLIRKWDLKKYKTWNGFPVQMVDYRSGGDLNLIFTTSDGKLVNTKEFFFDLKSPGAIVDLKKNNFEFEVVYELPIPGGGALRKTYNFNNSRYDVQVEFQFINLSNVVSNFQYQVLWENGLQYAEHNSVDESGFAAAYAFAGKELTEVDASHVGEKATKELSGKVDWIATRTKYFGVALIPSGVATDGAVIVGNRAGVSDNGIIERYELALKIPFKGSNDERASVGVFLGPLDHTLLKSYDNGLEHIMSLGAAWIIRPIAEYVFLPLFLFLHTFISNWGIVIIIFSIIIKLALHPLSRSQMRSMKKMQALQPLMEEVKEKYKDDPAKMNQAVMNLYKEYGVNPAGGCLPLILQLPILYALFSVFRSAIDLRQANFFGWIHDLSIPDIAFSLPLTLPIFAVKDISGIALVMGVTMFVQQKMTVKDPRQKAMVWMMPVMMTLMFNGFPSGLNLYYTMFNIFSIAQQIFIDKQGGNEPLRKVEPKKKGRGGFFGKLGDIPRLKK